jgi:hypothetical protein
MHWLVELYAILFPGSETRMRRTAKLCVKRTLQPFSKSIILACPERSA